MPPPIDDTRHQSAVNDNIELRSSLDEDSYPLQDHDPMSSERLLSTDDDRPTKTQQKLSPHKKALLKSSAINLFWITSWYTFATFLSVYNKWMFSAEHYNFQFPLFVSSIHMVVQFSFAGLSLLLVPSIRPPKRPTIKDYMYKVFPCALATSLDIGLSNLSLKTITLSFYTMCKSSTLAFVLVFAFLFRLEKPSIKLIGIILIIIVGVLLMVSDETEFELVGFIAVMTASACGGLRWSLTEVLLRKESMGLSNPFASIFFLAPAQAVVLLILAAAVEGYPTIFGSVFFVTLEDGLFTALTILIGGVLAFVMISSEFFLIKRTSVVTLSVCGIFKEVATIFISTLVFGDRLTVINTIGLCITLFGIALYNWLKLRRAAEQARKHIHDEELQHQLASTDDTNEHLSPPSSGGPMYSMVAESTPILLVDGAMTNYRESKDGLDNSDDDDEHNKRWDQYELR
ncbi:hypothetical protein LRAMOSA03736 [Lichtheimia ramosa]|uniref:Sugar phosphate transporter domain-containing protein n=1 Tax=Lichtheimia ramosa TaxID=688394 RepID=A0A077WWU0_9FUNG|nr:hypothetical protein LRAMOSA03736 [Lichtheimia ramosa]